MANFNHPFERPAPAYRLHSPNDRSQPPLLSRLLFLTFVVVSICGICLAYVHLNQKQTSLRKDINSLEGAIAISNKELDNLRVTAEGHKGNTILRQAQALGLQPPEIGQVIRLHRTVPPTSYPREQHAAINASLQNATLFTP
ncbi:MAG: hypothetical protein PHC30_09400 [Lentisphaeria bacterium]|nr:hypothetical protein [Lentisphaeria bacterium]